jgi:hypothetical protein
VTAGEHERALQVRTTSKARHAVEDVLRELVGAVPASQEAASAHPEERARVIVRAACAKAAAISGGLALPAGPLGLATVLPDLLAIWHVQRQVVVDVAAAFGKTAVVTQEQMVYCLFRHAASQLVRDLVVRAGERMLVRTLSRGAMQALLERIGVRVTQRVLGRAVSRWVPLIGAAAVGAYAWWDTRAVGRTAIDLFRGNLAVEGGTAPGEVAVEGGTAPGEVQGRGDATSSPAASDSHARAPARG